MMMKKIRDYFKRKKTFKCRLCDAPIEDLDILMTINIVLPNSKLRVVRICESCIVCMIETHEADCYSKYEN